MTLKLAGGLPRLRNVAANRMITACIRAAQKATFRLVHYSIQTNHLHLIVEADDRSALAAGMKGFVCRLARGLNKLWKRRGRVFPARFHDVVLRSLRQVRNALKYVLNNHLEHGGLGGGGLRPDPYSSGRFFDGWSGVLPEAEPGADGAPVVPACWKIRHGWKRHYRAISLDAVPGGSCS